MRSLGALLLVVLVFKYALAIAVLAAMFGLLAWSAWLLAGSTDARRRRDTDLSARADQQHQQTMAGDERGTYGAFPPAA